MIAQLRPAYREHGTLQACSAHQGGCSRQVFFLPRSAGPLFDSRADLTASCDAYKSRILPLYLSMYLRFTSSPPGRFPLRQTGG